MSKRDGIADILRTGEFPGSVIKGTKKGEHGNIHVDARHASPNYGYTTTTAKQTEQANARAWRTKAKAARETQKARRGTRRANDEMQSVGHIPWEVYTAMRLKHGNTYWNQNPKEKLKKHGLAFPS